MAIRQLLLDKACVTHYALTESRQNQIKRIMPLLSPVILDQLSPLVELQTWVHKVIMRGQYSAPLKSVLLEPVLEIKNQIMESGSGRWKKIAKEQYLRIFTKNHEELVEMAQW